MRRAVGVLPLDTATAGFVGIVVIAMAGAIAGSILMATRSAHPAAVTEVQARATAIQWVSSPAMIPGRAAITGWTVTSDRYLSSSWRVADSSGRLVFSESRGPCVPFLRQCGGDPVWEVELSAPLQGALNAYAGVVLIDATTGKVRAASVNSHN